MTIKVSRNRIDFGTTGMKNYAETVNALGNVSGNVVIDYSLGQVVTAFCVGATTWSVVNPPASGKAGNITLVLSSGGSATQTWPSGTKWSDGIAPTLSGGQNDVITFLTTDGGTTWLASAAILKTPLVLSVPTYGYFAGGNSDGVTSHVVVTTDRITFSTGATSANTASNLSQARWGLAALSDATNYGYFGGGLSAYAGLLVTADRITFSTGATSANTVSNLSQARYNLAALSDATTYGYFAGGVTNSVGANGVTADRITFSTGATAANTVSNLSQARSSLAGLSDKTTYGYFSGGDGSATSDRITFSTGATSANTVSNLSQARSELAGLSDATTYGYFAGGSTGDNVTTTDRVVFSTSATSANTVSNLSQARHWLAGLSDKTIYGYFAGGDSGAIVATADRIIFSTGITAANTVSNLSQARFGLAALSDFAV